MRNVEDHSPSQYEQNRNAILLLSFDEFSELEGYPWIRAATREEIAAEKERLETGFISALTGEYVPGRQDFVELHTGEDGTPYMWVVVDQTAPGHIWRQATSKLRLHRFREDA